MSQSPCTGDVVQSIICINDSPSRGLPALRGSLPDRNTGTRPRWLPRPEQPATEVAHVEASVAGRAERCVLMLGPRLVVNPVLGEAVVAEAARDLTAIHTRPGEHLHVAERHDLHRDILDLLGRHGAAVGPSTPTAVAV